MGEGIRGKGTWQPQRRWPWLTVVAVVTLLAATFTACRQPASTGPTVAARSELLGGVDPTQLNVILITIDTLRADRLSCYGSTRVETPNMDRFAREGVRFENAASTVPFTLPAHTSIMTGTYPPTHGVRENVGYVLEDGAATLARSMRDGGRETAGFVSSFVLDSRWGIGQGFDRFFDDFVLEGMEAANLGSVQRSGDETIAAAERWLDQRGSPSPFLLWLHLYDPHDPYTPPEPWASRYPGQPYNAEVAFTDSLVGRFREALETRGLLDQSLVIVTADHGEGLGDHGERFHGFFVYETTIHVPLIIRFPHATRAGTMTSGPVSHIDLMPTILDAVDLPAPDGLQGTSLLPKILDQEESPEREVYSESFYPLLHYGWAPLRSIRTDLYKLIDVPRPELYDLANDRRESSNLASQDPQVVDQLRARLQRLRQEMEQEAPSERAEAELDEETLAQLRALGYLAGSGGVTVEEEGDVPRADPKDKIDLHQMIMATQSQIGRGDTEAAAQLLNRVLESDPTIIDAHQLMGQIALRDDRFEEATGHFRNALQLDEHHKASLYGLASAYHQMGRNEEAILGFQRLLEISPRDIKAALPLTDLYEEAGRIDDAADVLVQICEQPEPPPVLVNRLGELRVLQGRGEDGRALFEQAIQLNAELGKPYYNLAVLNEEAGDIERAVGLYESAIERGPKNYQAQFNLGRLYGLKGDIVRQQAMWEAAIESKPDFARGHHYLAKLMMDRGDLASAEDLARKGIAADPDGHAGPLGYFVLADILNRTGRPTEAQHALAKGREIQAQPVTNP